MYRHKDKPYHIDYCFLSKNLAENLHSVEVGDFDTWTISDHVPVIVTLNKLDRQSVFHKAIKEHLGSVFLDLADCMYSFEEICIHQTSCIPRC
jgi:hypothetical protein